MASDAQDHPDDMFKSSKFMHQAAALQQEIVLLTMASISHPISDFGEILSTPPPKNSPAHQLNH